MFSPQLWQLRGGIFVVWIVRIGYQLNSPAVWSAVLRSATLSIPLLTPVPRKIFLNLWIYFTTIFQTRECLGQYLHFLSKPLHDIISLRLLACKPTSSLHALNGNQILVRLSIFFSFSLLPTPSLPSTPPRRQAGEVS